MVEATFHEQILLLSMQLLKSMDSNSDDDNASGSNAKGFPLPPKGFPLPPREGSWIPKY
jgi:hypothetical protein